MIFLQFESWVFVKSIFMLLLAIRSLYYFTRHCKSHGFTRKGFFMVGLPVILISITYFFRTYAAVYQMNLGTVRASCFKLKDNAIHQSPFDWKCYGKIDLILLLLLVISTVIAIKAAVTIIIRKDDKTKYQNGTEMK